MATKRNNRVSRDTLKQWSGCDIDFTITSKGESIRRYAPGCTAKTRDVICMYPNIEVRRDGTGWYVCQYRRSAHVAVYLSAGSSMQDAVAYGLGSIRKAGYTVKDLKRKAAEARKPESTTTPNVDDMIERAFS